MFYILICVCLISIVFGNSIDDGQITWDEEVQLKLTDSSFYRNLSPTNQAQVLAIYKNEQMTADEMDEEFDDWVNKQTLQIQAAAKQYEQNLNLANEEITAYKQEIMSNLSSEAQTYLQQLYENDTNLTTEQIKNRTNQLYQSLSPNVAQEIDQYFGQLLEFMQQTYPLYLSNQLAINLSTPPPIRLSRRPPIRTTTRSPFRRTTLPIRPTPRSTPVRPTPPHAPVRSTPPPTPVRPSPLPTSVRPTPRPTSVRPSPPPTSVFPTPRPTPVRPTPRPTPVRPTSKG